MSEIATPSASAGAMPALADEFRLAMRRLAGGVCIITGLADGARLGITATAVCSLSADPPSLLVCINQRSSLCAALAPGRTFCINVLNGDQADIASTFGSSRVQAERFLGNDWRCFDDGIPYLPDAQCSIRCCVDGMIDYGSHRIFIGKAGAIRISDPFHPLVYGNGAYHHLHPIA